MCEGTKHRNMFSSSSTTEILEEKMKAMHCTILF